MSLALRPAAVLLVLLGAAPPAHAFVRSTTSSGDPRQGACLLWSQKGLTYRINASAFASIPGCDSAAAAADLARASFPAWTQATAAGGASPCTDFAFTDGGDTTVRTLGNDGVNLVVFRKGLCSAFAAADPNCAPAAPENQRNVCIQDHNCWSHGDPTIIALTTTTFRARNGEIIDADMELHGWNGSLSAPTGWYFTCGGPGVGPCPSSNALYTSKGCNWIDVGATVTHEAGHMLGLDHVCCDPAAVMFPSTGRGESPKRVLAADDVAGVCAIYPRGQPASATAGCLGQPPAPSSGCGAGGADLPGLLLAAGLGLRRLLRRRPGRAPVHGHPPFAV